MNWANRSVGGVPVDDALVDDIDGCIGDKLINVDGFLNLHKPAGLTSHDCVMRVRKLLHIKRVGHAGTLDPAATGVLPIAMGRATRLLQFLPSGKAYEAVIRFGYRTSTDDLEGDIISRAADQTAAALSLDVVQQQLPQFLGKLQQIPPQYSAIQVQGKRLYDLARSGQTVEVQPRAVEVFKLDILDWQPGEYPELRVAIACSAGTYIRSIARDWGELVGTGATLAKLIRTASSGLHLANSIGLEELQTQLATGEFQPIPPEHALAHLPIVTLPDQVAKQWCHGQVIAIAQTSITLTTTDPQAPLPTAVRVHHEDGSFLGIAQPEPLDSKELLSPGQIPQVALTPQVVFKTDP